jgi:hypothetical protein
MEFSNSIEKTMYSYTYGWLLSFVKFTSLLDYKTCYQIRPWTAVSTFYLLCCSLSL